MSTKTIKVRFSNGVLEPLDKVDIPEGKVLIISIVGEPNKSDKKKFVEGINASFGGWKDLVDCDELKKNINNAQEIDPKTLKRKENDKMIDVVEAVDENFLIQMSSQGYAEWLSEKNDIYDELFKDE